ncbi:MAG: SprT family zinc-dependent metalloprotease [Bacteroidales bacterium]
MIVKEYPHIGNVNYVYNPRAKRVIVKVKPDLSVWVTLPLFAEIEKAETFLLSRVSWIESAKHKVQQKNGTPGLIENNVLVTKHHTIQFVETAKSHIAYSIENTIIRVYLPAGVHIDNKDVQQCATIAKKHAFKIEAYEYVPRRLNELAQKFGFSFARVTITSAKTRWGSCSSRNNINISCYIMQLPTHLIDFVLVHELCHTIHKNHGNKFHNLLNACVSGYEKEYTRQLRAYSIV